MSKPADIAMELANVHDDFDKESFTTNIAELFSDDQMDNIAGVILGVSYKDGMTKTLTYIAENQDAKDIFNNIYGTIASGLKKLLEVKKE